MTNELENIGRRIEKVDLDISSLKCECAIWKIKQNQKIGGYIGFSGVYRYGSAGTDDAKFIDWRIEEFIDLVRPNGIVVSFYKMEYEWGDDLGVSWSHEDGPLRIVCNRDSYEEAYKGALSGYENIMVRHSLKEAMEEVSSELKEK